MTPLPLVLGLALTALTPLPTLTVGEHTFHRRTLANGLEALAVDDGQGGRVSVFVVYAAGTRAETEATTGLAHLTEHALFTGTSTTALGKHDAAIKAMGGESNAYTRADFTTYYAHKIPAERLRDILALEADRMRHLTWKEEGFLYERERLREEEAHSNKDDLQIGARRAYAIWGGRGYGPGLFDAKGNTKGPTLTLAQSRAFYDTWYRPRNAAVVVVGSKPQVALDAIQAAFGEHPAGPRPPELSTPVLGSGEITISAPLSRPRREWVWMGPSLHEPRERLALALLSELVEGRKTTDGAPIEVWQGGRVGPDLFVIAATGDQAEAGVQGTWQILQDGSWSDAELTKAKASLRDDFTSLPLRARPYFSLAVSVATLVAYGHADYATKLGDRLDGLGRADLIAAAKRWLTPGRRITVRFDPTGESAKAAPLPDDAGELRKAADAAQASGDYERAIAAYERLLTKNPGRVNLVIYRYQLGHLHQRLGRLEKAREHLLAGLKVVEYPALRELLEKVEAEMKGALAEPGSKPTAPTSKPTAPASKPTAPTSKPTAPESPHGAKPAKASKHKVVGTKGEVPPAWASQGTKVMGQLEGWRGLSFKTDLVVEFLKEAKDGPAGWYEPDTKRLVVTLRGTERFGKGTMLHEMHHALQDQHYDLIAVHERAKTPDANRAVTSLIEGEAMLAVQELMDYDFSKHAKIPPEGPLNVERFKKVFHYGSGLQFILAVRKARGWKGVRAAFKNPPTSTAEVFHPERYLAGWKPQVLKDPPPREPDQILLGSDAQGEFGLRVFLSRSPETRPLAVELGAALAGDLQHRIQNAEGVQHTWHLEFTSEDAAKRCADAAKIGLRQLEGARSAPPVHKGRRVVLEWTAQGSSE